MGYDRDGYETYDRPHSVTYHDGPIEGGQLYPGGAHRTWGKTRGPGVPYWQRFATEPSGPEPEGAAAQRRRDNAEEKQRIRAGERLHPIDPADPWSEAAWSPCQAGCSIHDS